MLEFDDYKPLFRKAMDHYEFRLRKLKGDSEIEELKLRTLENDIIKNADSVKDVLNQFDERVDEHPREPLRRMLCLALTCYIVDLEGSIELVRSKIGNLNIHFEDLEKEIKLAKEARDFFCPTDWKYTI